MRAEEGAGQFDQSGDSILKKTMGILRLIWTENFGFDKFKYILQAVIWQFRKKQNHVFIKKLHTGAYIKVYPYSAYTSIFYFKWHERVEQQFIRKHAKLAPTFVDVGANVGLFSAYVIDCFKSFYLFEPSPSTFKALQETCKLNSLVQWNLFNVGVADQKGSMEFIDEGSHSSTSRFSDKHVPSAGLSPTIIVDVDTLDNLIPHEIGDIIIKVDVEGFEERVFKGADRLFHNKQVKLVMFERLGRTNLHNLMNFFKSHNYIVFSVQQDGSISTDTCVISVPLINLFAAHDSVFKAFNSVC